MCFDRCSRRQRAALHTYTARRSAQCPAGTPAGTSPCVWEEEPGSTQRKAQSLAEGVSPVPGSRHHAGPKDGGWQQRAGGRKDIHSPCLFCGSWGCYHNSMDSSPSSAEHMGNLSLAYHFEPFLPLTHLPPAPQESSIWYRFCRLQKKKKNIESGEASFSPSHPGASSDVS